MNTSAILALDPASRCGFAHTCGVHGVWDLRAPGHAGRRLSMLRSAIDAIAEKHGCDRIAYEEASMGSPNRNVQARHNELAGVIQLTAYELDVPFYAYHPMTIKKFATGSGRATKDQMIAACKTVLGIEVESDDVADALWVLELAERELVTTGRTSGQRDGKLFT